jgi:hypothetical protein
MIEKPASNKANHKFTRVFSRRIQVLAPETPFLRGFRTP